MRWKRVAWAGCLAPAVGGGCFTTHPMHDLTADPLLAHTEQGIERAIRRDAREAWREVRGQYPRKVFTAEFRDGFLDGYADYLDRGGSAQPPAVPPPRYTRNKKYFTPEGHALLRDYFLGFKYGVDVAVATGQRQYLTVPVLIPEGGDHLPPVVPASATAVPATVVIPPTPVPLPAAVPPPAPLAAPRPLPAPASTPPLTKTETKPADTGIPGFHQPAWGTYGKLTAGTKGTRPPAATPPKTGSGTAASSPAQPSVSPELIGSKFLPVPRLEDPPTTAPVISIPAPTSLEPGTIAVPALPPGDPMAERFPPPGPPLQVGVPKLDFPIKLPEPPAEVPSLPTHVPTPPVMDDFPVIPPNHTVPPPLPANLSDDVRK